MLKLKAAIRKLVFKFITPPVINNSNSQAGEDRIVDYLFTSMGIDKISYIDIGASNPVNDNNTYLFYLKHNRGILVEPDISFNHIAKDTRPGDVVVNAAIGDTENSEVDFYIFNHSSLNTLSEEEANLRVQSGIYKVIEKKRIKLLTIETIINTYLDNQTPDLISLDVEGVDYAILSAFDFEKHPVSVWIVETCQYSENHIKPKVTAIIELMLTKGYFVFADTYINTIFVSKIWFENHGK